MSGLRYIALKPLRVGIAGETVLLQPGEEIPNPEEWGRSLNSNLDAGTIAAVPAGGGPSLASLDDEALLAEVEARGLKPTAAKKQKTA